MEHGILMKLLLVTTFLTGILNASCLPGPQPQDFTNLLVASALLAPHGDCLYAGLNNSVANGGILACSSFNNRSCGQVLMFNQVSDRTPVTNQINTIGTTFSNCLVPASNALTELNSLSLPAYHYMHKAGGTTGAHLASNFHIETISGCGALGIVSSAYMGGASRIANSDEMSFLSSAQGLVAIKDAGGTCRSQMGLSTSQNQIAQDYLSNNISLFAECDYGTDDATKTHCPVSLQRNDLMFSGITTW